MFIRSKTFQEERKMTFIYTTAQLVKTEEISQKIKSPNNSPIPEYVKRVKRLNSKFALMITEIEEIENNSANVNRNLKSRQDTNIDKSNSIDNSNTIDNANSIDTDNTKTIESDINNNITKTIDNSKTIDSDITKTKNSLDQEHHNTIANDNNNPIITNTVNEGQYFLVQIPEFQPITEMQYRDANEKWPCYFFNHKKPEIDQKQAIFRSRILIEKFNQISNENTLPHRPIKREYSSYKFNFNNGNSHLFNLIKTEFPSSNISFDFSQLNQIDLSTHLNSNVDCSQICMIFDNQVILACSIDHEPIVGHSVTEAIRIVSQSEYGYLCTGFTAFLLREPCTSCAMALVHGRIKQVFILEKRGEGAFSKFKLNHNRDLNHRFEVYFYEE